MPPSWLMKYWSREVSISDDPDGHAEPQLTSASISNPLSDSGAALYAGIKYTLDRRDPNTVDHPALTLLWPNVHDSPAKVVTIDLPLYVAAAG